MTAQHSLRPASLRTRTWIYSAKPASVGVLMRCTVCCLNTLHFYCRTHMIAIDYCYARWSVSKENPKQTKRQTWNNWMKSQGTSITKRTAAALRRRIITSTSQHPQPQRAKWIFFWFLMLSSSLFPCTPHTPFYAKPSSGNCQMTGFQSL